MIEKSSKKLLSMLKRSRKEIKSGQVSPTFSDAKDAIAWLHNENRKYETQ